MGLRLEMPDELGKPDPGTSPGGRSTRSGKSRRRPGRRDPVDLFVRWVETWAL